MHDRPIIKALSRILKSMHLEDYIAMLLKVKPAELPGSETQGEL